MNKLDARGIVDFGVLTLGAAIDDYEIANDGYPDVIVINNRQFDIIYPNADRFGLEKTNARFRGILLSIRDKKPLR